MRALPRRLAPAALAFAALATIVASARADEPERCATEAEEGQAARAAGKLRAARAHVIACSRESCPRVVRNDCVRWLVEVETELPSVVIRAHDATGADVSDVTVFVDGEMVAERVDGRPIAVDAGEHVVRIARRSGAAVSQRLVVRSGEHARIVSMQLEAGEVRAKNAGSAGPWTLGGVGLGLLGGGAALWAVGRSEHGDLESTCAPTGSCATRDVDAARTKLIIGDVVAAVGVIAVAGAVYWYLTSGSSPGRVSQRTTPLTF